MDCKSGGDGSGSSDASDDPKPMVGSLDQRFAVGGRLEDDSSKSVVPNARPSELNGEMHRMADLQAHSSASTHLEVCLAEGDLCLWDGDEVNERATKDIDTE